MATPVSPGGRASAIIVLAALILANITAWSMGVRIAGSFPVLLGSMALAYVLGLKHAFDADHIAAIDNVTRRLVATGARPVGVGLFFSLGHSTVVMLAAVGAALAASRFHGAAARLQDWLSPYATLFSSGFLILIAGSNLIVLLQLWGRFRRERREEASPSADSTTGTWGLFSAALHGVLHRVNRSWLMFPLGFVFALGFDTATEISLLGLAAAQAAHGLPLWAILIFPTLFAAGMALADTWKGG